MESIVFRRVREALTRRREELRQWFKQASPEERALRAGPAAPLNIQRQIGTLDEAVAKTEDNSLGICDVCHEYVEPSLLEMDFMASVCLSHLTGEEQTRLENDLELSAKVQRALLPHELPAVRGLDIAAFSRPARIVGGDYFDFVRMANGSHAFIIADVMGKGMPASMLMASLQTSLRILAPEHTDPVRVVQRLNQIFNHNIQLTKFVSLFMAIYEEETRLLTYCNAGHNPPLIFGRDGTCRQLMPTGAAIGLMEDGVFSQETITLKPGDRVLLYTDGVVESADNGMNMFGTDQLVEFLAESGNRTAQEIVVQLRSKLQAFMSGAPQNDDTTIVAITVE